MTDIEKIDREIEDFTDDLSDEALDRSQGDGAACGTTAFCKRR